MSHFSEGETEAQRGELRKDTQQSVTGPGSFPLEHSIDPETTAMWLYELVNSPSLRVCKSDNHSTGICRPDFLLSKEETDALHSPCRRCNSMILWKMKMKEGTADFRHVLQSTSTPMISCDLHLGPSLK